jgi:cysteine desulfurase
LTITEAGRYAENIRMPINRIYFDHNATTPVDPAVLAEMVPYLSGEYGNASSVHHFGQKARGAVEQAREQVAALVGAQPAEIVFTSGGTESDNAAILGVTGLASAAGKRVHVITTTIEHAAVLHTCKVLERRPSTEVTYLPVSMDGVVDPEEVRQALRPETTLITVMHANNELGTLQPIEEIGRIAAEAGVTFHTDAVQSAGKVPVDVTKLGVQLLSLSAHKICGPKGVGALYVRKGLRLAPIMYGGHSERDRRAGTENVPGIAGFGKAAELAAAHLTEEAARLAGLRDLLQQGLLERVPGARVNGGAASRTPNTCNMLFPGVESESLVIALDLRGIACSAGAACSSGATDPSHVLAAIGLSDADARGCVRLSLGSNNTAEDVEQALEIVPAVIAAHRSAAVPTP